jgi:glycosyltransferase involved in cell wall biosynthesis
MKNNNNLKLSIVIPCFNEEDVLAETIRQLLSLADSLSDLNVEIIFVDDGSSDQTLEILEASAADDKRIKIISFSRNFGHQIAVTAGVNMATGNAVVLIDADLQDPPEVIHQMLEKWREGFDVVYGVRTEREGESLFKLGSAKLFYRILNKLSSVAIPLDTGDFRLMDRCVVNVLASMPEQNRFVRGMVAWVGFKQFALPYKRVERFAGVSKYPLRKMLRFALDGILSFSIKPLQVAIGFGFVCAAFSIFGILYALFLRLYTSNWVEGWTALMIAVLFIGGVQLICLGILGEYVGRIYNEAKRRPLYIVKKQIGFEKFDSNP